MTNTTTNAAGQARMHAEQAWQTFTQGRALTDTKPAWEEEHTPDGSLLLSGLLTGLRARYALYRFARDYWLTLGPADVRPQFDIHQPGRTVLVWRRDGVWVQLWHPDSVVDAPQAPEPVLVVTEAVLGAAVPSTSAPAAPVAPVPVSAAPAVKRPFLAGPSARLRFTRKQRNLNDKETTTS